eukprot:Selendium_serpulae@DN3271_c0_g1_i1.p2
MGSNPFYAKLANQVRVNQIDILDDSSVSSIDYAKWDVIVDAIFGFSFKGSLRAPFDTILADVSRQNTPPIVSVDVPSGWDVETGAPDGPRPLTPAVLVSLTAPKTCASKFDGRHFVGGRFVPKSVQEKYEMRLPDYKGADQIVEI